MENLASHINKYQAELHTLAKDSILSAIYLSSHDFLLKESILKLAVSRVIE